MNVAFYCLPEARKKPRDAAFPCWSLRVSNIDLVWMTRRSSHQPDVMVDRQVPKYLGRGKNAGAAVHAGGKALHC